MKKNKPDFSGYVTRYNLKCTDGRIIEPGAFAHMDGRRVPLVWKHLHDSPSNVLGSILLNAKPDGMYGIAEFNNSGNAADAKAAVQHQDIKALSIHAINVKQNGPNVKRGDINEVSLVYKGANPGASIDYIEFSQDDDASNEAIIYMGDIEFEHEDSRTVGQILDGMDEKKKKVMAAVLVMELQNGRSAVGKSILTNTLEAGESVEDVFNSMSEEEKTASSWYINETLKSSFKQESTEESMKEHLFETKQKSQSTKESEFSHEEMKAFVQKVADKKGSSLRSAMKESGIEIFHDGVPGVDYGVTDLDKLFPDGWTDPNGKMPAIIRRNQEWVKRFLKGTRHVPYSRIKSTFVDITEEVARAKGYIKGNEKVDGVIKAAKRKTSPGTIYVKRRIDRDDVLDSTDFDIMAFNRMEMRELLDEEIARAALVSDGRPETGDDDKINEETIRPIYKDDSFYVIRQNLLPGYTNNELVDIMSTAKIDYEGSGTLVLFLSPKTMASLRTERDEFGHRMYKTNQDIADAFGVSAIVETKIIDGITRTVSTGPDEAQGDYDLIGIALDLNDYTFGTDKGGETTFFDDFDIDFNQMKMLYETRLSGALTVQKSAIVLEQFTVAP